MDCNDFPVDYNFFEMVYCGHPNSPYANIKLEQTTKLILSHFRENTIYSFMIQSKTKRHNWFPFFYRPKKNASRTDIANNDQNTYAFAPTYGYESTAFTVILYQLLHFSTQIHLKVCWWITQLQRWVPFVIIRMLHYVPEQ